MSPELFKALQVILGLLILGGAVALSIGGRMPEE